MILFGNLYSIFKARHRKNGKSYIFNRRSYRFWRFIPHTIYFCAVFTFTFSHHHFADTILLVVTCPMIFWCISILLRPKLGLDRLRKIAVCSEYLKTLFNEHLKLTIFLTTAFYLYPLISLYRNSSLFFR